MTPEEKAEDLITKMTAPFAQSQDTKFYALTCAREILSSWKNDGNSRLDVGICIYWEKVIKILEDK